MSLFNIPFGRPDAAVCRWCKTQRERRKLALICPHCDRPVVSATITNTSSSTEEKP